jgi:hypothetical protein
MDDVPPPVGVCEDSITIALQKPRHTKSHITDRDDSYCCTNHFGIDVLAQNKDEVKSQM